MPIINSSSLYNMLLSVDNYINYPLIFIIINLDF
jgi:hypothetical protein